MEDLDDMRKSLKVVRNSSMMINMLNSGLLNQTLMKQNQFSPRIERVKNLQSIVQKLARMFDG